MKIEEILNHKWIEKNVRMFDKEWNVDLAKEINDILKWEKYLK